MVAGGRTSHAKDVRSSGCHNCASVRALGEYRWCRKGQRSKLILRDMWFRTVIYAHLSMCDLRSAGSDAIVAFPRR
jgi:hypothetical protein